MKQVFALLLFSVVLVWGCKKEDDAKPKTKSELIARKWQFQTAKVTLGTTPITAFERTATSGNLVDFSSSYMDFKADGSFSQSLLPGTTATGTWKLSSDETAFVITTTGSGAVDTWKIDQLSDTNLNFSRDIAGTSTDPSDQSWLGLIKSYGFPPAATNKIEVKAVPAP